MMMSVLTSFTYEDIRLDKITLNLSTETYASLDQMQWVAVEAKSW